MANAPSPLVELTAARTKEFIRQPEAVFWTFMFPVLLAVALGFAFREKPADRIPIAIVDSAEAGTLIAAVQTSDALIVRKLSRAVALEELRTGRVSLVIEPGPSLVYRFDPTRPDSRIARLEADAALQAAAGRRDAIASKEITAVERGGRYIDFVIPGLLAMNLMGTGMWGIGFSMVTARNQKLLKRLAATPMRRSDYLLSQMLSRLLFLVGEVVVLIGFAWLVFHVEIRGSILLFSFVTVLGAAAFSAIGLLVAARPQTIEGVSGLMNFVMLPMWLLSGVFFSSERFPDWSQPFIQSLPLTALVDALRGIMIEARGFADVSPELLILGVWLVVPFAVALKIFRWQ